MLSCKLGGNGFHFFSILRYDPGGISPQSHGRHFTTGQLSCVVSHTMVDPLPRVLSVCGICRFLPGDVQFPNVRLLVHFFPPIHLLYSFPPAPSVGEDCPSCHRAKAGLHHGQVKRCNKIKMLILCCSTR